jgi:hypothetical protein
MAKPISTSLLTFGNAEESLKMKTVAKKISKREVKSAIETILAESRTIDALTFVRAFAFNERCICVINHDTQAVSYHKSLSMLVAKTGEVSDTSLLNDGYYLIGEGCEHNGMTSWLIDTEDRNLSDIGYGVFATVAA